MPMWWLSRLKVSRVKKVNTRPSTIIPPSPLCLQHYIPVMKIPLQVLSQSEIQNPLLYHSSEKFSEHVSEDCTGRIPDPFPNITQTDRNLSSIDHDIKKAAVSNSCKRQDPSLTPPSATKTTGIFLTFRPCPLPFWSGSMRQRRTPPTQGKWD